MVNKHGWWICLRTACQLVVLEKPKTAQNESEYPLHAEAALLKGG